MPKSLLDLMPKEEAEKALANAQKRLERQMSRKGLDVSPEIYLVSEMGYYFDWEAILAIRRGYTVTPKTDEDLAEDRKLGKKPEWTSKYKREIFTLEEAQILLEGARKVWRGKLAEQAHAGIISNSFKVGATTFESAVKPFTDAAEVKV